MLEGQCDTIFVESDFLWEEKKKSVFMAYDEAEKPGKKFVEDIHDK